MTATALSLLVFIIVYVLLTAKTIKVEDDSYQEQKPIFL